MHRLFELNKFMKSSEKLRQEVHWYIHFLKPLADMDAVFSVAAIRGGGGGGCVDRVPVLAVLTTSTCMLPVLSRLSRSARGFIRCLESEGGGSLLNSSWCKMVGVAGGAGGELGDVNATGALTAESSASNECLTHTHTHTHTHMDWVVAFDESDGWHTRWWANIPIRDVHVRPQVLQVNGGIDEDVEIEPALAVTRDRRSMAEVELHRFWWAYMPICDVQVRPQVMQLKMFTVGFDVLAWFFLRVRRSSRLAIRWFSNCTSELWQSVHRLPGFQRSEVPARNDTWTSCRYDELRKEDGGQGQENSCSP